jgi:hypothetical protein
MNLGRCPCCHTRLHLDALVQDEAGRELLAILAGLDETNGRALVLYLSLFRPAARDLANDRALRLARGALALGEGQAPGVLAAAMYETVDSLRGKGGDPLSDHNYLKKVIKTCAGRMEAKAGANLIPSPQPSPGGRGSQGQPVSATGKGIAKLQGMKRRED